MHALHSSIGNRAFIALLTTVQRQARPPAPPKPAEEKEVPDARDWAKSAVDKLPKKQKERFEAVAWGRLDFPDTVVSAKGLSKEAADWWRAQPSVVEVEDEKNGNYFKGANQAEAQRLLDALARATSGGGERRVNRGPVAVLKERAFKLAKDDFDKVFVDKLDANKIDGHQLNVDAAAKFREMAAAARNDKVTLKIGSAYRSRADEEATAKKIPNRKAFAGFSPHSMGLAVDINLKTTGYSYKEFATGDFNKVLDMLESPVYKWLSAHASDYGFYPFSLEPWHWEYNPEGFAEKFFEGNDALQSKITEADEAEEAERKAAAEKAAAKKAKLKGASKKRKK